MMRAEDGKLHSQLEWPKEYVSKNSEVSCHLPGNRENLLFRDFAVLAL